MKKTIEERITELLDKREDETKKLKDKIRLQEQTISDLQERSRKLVLEGPDEDFIKVKKELDETHELKALLEERLKRLQEQPLANADEQKAVADEINEKYAKLREKYMGEVGALALQAYDAALDFKKQGESLNAAYVKYQTVIGKKAVPATLTVEELAHWGTVLVIDFPAFFEEGTGKKYVERKLDQSDYLYSYTIDAEGDIVDIDA